jgi:methionyl-tRNA formyltransferase
MTGKKLRLLVLTHGSEKAATIIERLLTLPCAEVKGIFIETERSPRRYSLREKIKRSIRYYGFAETLSRTVSRFFTPAPVSSGPSKNSHQRLQEIADAHQVPVHFVPNYHLPESIELMRDVDADLGVVLGTNILKESVFSIPRLGSINVHQGLTPYYRGGPPVFWELFNGEGEVGLTVHYVAAKVDTGDVIAQDRIPLVYDYGHRLNYESFIEKYREKLFARTAELLPLAIQMIADGSVKPIPQNIELGKRYRLPVKKEKDELRRRLRQRRGEERKLSAGTIGIENPEG